MTFLEDFMCENLVEVLNVLGYLLSFSFQKILIEYLLFERLKLFNPNLEEFISL